MNKDQLSSIVRSVLKVAGSAMAAHGMTKGGEFINTEDVIGVVLAIVGLVMSHFQHHDDNQPK